MKKKILIVEDEPAMAEAARLKLEKAGFEVKWCMSAEIAIEWLKDNMADFIWLDILLPGMSGIEFLKTLRESEKYKNIPVMLVTVSAGPDRMKKAFELDVVDVVVKSEHEIGEIVDQVSTYFESCSGEC